MDGLQIPEVGSSPVDGCANTRKRCLNEKSPCDSTSLAHKQIKLDSTGEASQPVLPSSGNDGTPVGSVLIPGEKEENKEEGEESRVRCLSYGLISVIGRRRVMEDAVTVAVDGKINGYDLFAVYDGHCGSYAAKAYRYRLHLLIAEAVDARMASIGGGISGEAEYWKKVMGASFKKMDKEVRDGQVEGGTAGSMALVVLVGKEKLVVANCGNSRAVLCRDGVAVPISRDHKANRTDEKETVKVAAGTVINWSGSRIVGVPSTSRSIGDEYMKSYITYEPEVVVMERAKIDEFLIIASDGLWDVVSNEFACEIVRSCLSGQLNMRSPEEANESGVADAAALLAEVAMARGSCDNITIIVVELQKLKT